MKYWIIAILIAILFCFAGLSFKNIIIQSEDDLKRFKKGK